MPQHLKQLTLEGFAMPELLPEAMGEIETAARAYAEARGTLDEHMRQLEADLSAIRRQRIGTIKVLAAKAAGAKATLAGLVAMAPEGFRKPKTRLFHGIKCGFVKRPGRMTWSDEGRVVELIRRLLPDQAEVLIKTSETPVKKALSGLDAGTLMRLGVQVTDTGEAVVVEAADSEIDKLVDALLQEPSIDAVEAQAEKAA